MESREIREDARSLDKEGAHESGREREGVMEDTNEGEREKVMDIKGGKEPYLSTS